MRTREGQDAEVAIIDGGGANIASLRFALERLGRQAVLTTDPERIATANHVILPGVGAARKRALLAHFGSAKAVARAGVDDLMAVEGISETLAQTIYDRFHAG